MVLIGGVMIYLLSLVVYVVVFMACMYIIKTQPDKVEKLITKICFVGFCSQLMINYLFWGNISAFGIISQVVSIERSAINLMFLCLTSIFCYASLLALLFKANDFYNE